jgi:hypothetical protein
MPTIYIYLSEEEYVKLVHLALQRQVKTSQLIHQAVQKFIKEGGE